MTRPTSSRLAGFLFLFYIATGVAGMAIFAPTTRGEGTAAKLASLVQHATLTRAGAVFALLMMLNAIVLGVALYSLTRDEDPDLALLALICRVVEGVIAIAGAFLRRALLLTATASDAAVNTALGSLLLRLQGFGTLLGATAFAIGSTIFCYLFLRARTVPSSLAWLGLIASILLVIGLPLQIVALIDGPVLWLMWIPAAIFEVTFGLWLMIKGVAPQAAY